MDADFDSTSFLVNKSLDSSVDFPGAVRRRMALTELTCFENHIFLDIFGQNVLDAEYDQFLFIMYNYSIDAPIYFPEGLQFKIIQLEILGHLWTTCPEYTILRSVFISLKEISRLVCTPLWSNKSNKCQCQN